MAVEMYGLFTPMAEPRVKPTESDEVKKSKSYLLFQSLHWGFVAFTAGLTLHGASKIYSTYTDPDFGEYIHYSDGRFTPKVDETKGFSELSVGIAGLTIAALFAAPKSSKPNE